jgi:hypothetical protein
MHLPLTLALLASGFGGMAQVPAKQDTPATPAEKAKAKAASTAPSKQKKRPENDVIELADTQIRTMRLLLTSLIRGGDKKQLAEKKGKSKDLVQNKAADPENSIISWAAQGIPLDAKLTKGDIGDYVYICKLLDRLNPRDVMFGLNKKTLSSIYGDIMDFSVPLESKTKKLPETPEIKAAYALTSPKSEAMINYRKYQGIYAQAVAARDAEMVTNLKDTGRPRASDTTINAVTNALADFTHPDEGNAANIRSALEKIRQYEATDPAVFLNKRRDLWNRGLVEDAYIVDTYPRPESWADEKGWFVFKYKSTELIDEAKYSKIDTDNRVRYDKGIVNVDVNVKYDETETYKMKDDQSYTVEMSVKRVFVSWPWLDTDVFDHVSWKWNNQKQGVVVSDGKGTSTTQLPYLMDSIILVKGVVIKTAATSDLKTFMEQNIKVKADISVGPFTLNSETNKKDTRTFINNKTKEISIEIPDPQIIAVVATKVPKAP